MAEKEAVERIISGQLVGGVDYPRNWREFQAFFPDERSGVAYLAHLRWSDGFRCRECGHDRCWLRGSDGRLLCCKCRAKTSVTAGTLFDKSTESRRASSAGKPGPRARSSSPSSGAGTTLASLITPTKAALHQERVRERPKQNVAQRNPKRPGGGRNRAYDGLRKKRLEPVIGRRGR